MSTLTTSDVRQKNKERILQFIYSQKSTCQQLICESLHLSRPTVIPILRECEAEKLIEKNGYYESTGGRKAAAILFNAHAKLALGVELLQDVFKISALNLYGETLSYETYDLPFENSDRYCHNICDSILTFIKENTISEDKLLGIGIVLQGLISSDGNNVTYGKILNCTGLQISSFTKYLPYPCKFFHDAEAAARDELWKNPKLCNAIYINIRSHVSGTVIVNREFLKGTELKSGVFEHMSLVPNGRACYCGHKGCMETYCSTQPLLNTAGSLEHFFIQLQTGNDICVKQWNEYLDYLATSINNLRMFIDYPIILGGTLAPYLENKDIETLHKLFCKKSAFPTDTLFIHSSKCDASSISRGAAIFYIKEYLGSVMGKV